MANTNLTNQRQVFVEDYVCTGDHLAAAKKAVLDTKALINCVTRLVSSAGSVQMK